MTDNRGSTSTTQEDEVLSPDHEEEVAASTTEGEQVVTAEAPESTQAASTEAVPAAEAPASTEAVPGAETSEVSGAEPPAAEVEGEEEEEEDEEEEEEAGGFDFFAPGDWYVVHTYAGYENKVKANLGSRIQSMNMEDKIYEVVVPTEEVMELKSGRMQSVQKKVFPGYILVRMDLDDDSWYVVRNTPGVTGFVGSGTKPTPLEPDEVNKILVPAEEERTAPKLAFEIGEVVSVIAGAFAGYSGPVETIDQEKQVVRVLLDLFGRETPVELTFDQVTKL